MLNALIDFPEQFKINPSVILSLVLLSNNYPTILKLNINWARTDLKLDQNLTNAGQSLDQNCTKTKKKMGKNRTKTKIKVD